MPRRISEKYFWYEVKSPLIPNDSCSYTVAALHEDQATTIVSKKFKVKVYVDDERTSIKKIGSIGKFEERAIKICSKTSEEKNLPEKKMCPNCGCSDHSIGSDCCPNCNHDYPERWYSIFEESKNVVGEL